MRKLFRRLCLLMLLAGCAREDSTAEFHGKTMGTTYQVTYALESGASGASGASGNASGNELMAAAEALLAEITSSLSTYDPGSLLSSINAATNPAIWHPVDKHFSAVFRRSREIYEDTGHTFNPAVGPLVNAWGFGPEDHDTSPDEKTVRELLEVVRFDAFEMQESPPAVKKRIAAAKLDFSAIGEGYAIDAIGEMLESHGVKDYLIELGGELRARGRAWKVGIERAGQSELRVVQLKDAGLATSGTYRNFRTENGKKIAHILDPRTGHPADNSLVSVSVIAKDTMTADAVATALMVMGLEEGMRFVEARPELQAFFIAMGESGKLVEKETAGFPRK